MTQKIDHWTPMSFDFLDQTTEDFLRSGASVDQVYIFDLPNVNLANYKAIVFMNTYKVSTSMRSFIENKIYTPGRTVVWQYLPGLTDGSLT